MDLNVQAVIAKEADAAARVVHGCFTGREAFVVAVHNDQQTGQLLISACNDAVDSGRSGHCGKAKGCKGYHKLHRQRLCKVTPSGRLSSALRMVPLSKVGGYTGYTWRHPRQMERFEYVGTAGWTFISGLDRMATDFWPRYHIIVPVGFGEE